MSTCGKELPGFGPDTPSESRQCKKTEGHAGGCAWWREASTHDRGTFGGLLAEAKALGCGGVDFYVDFNVPDESDQRWFVTSYAPASTKGFRRKTPDQLAADIINAPATGLGMGRTGEEALRRLVESLRNPDANAT